MSVRQLLDDYEIKQVEAAPLVAGQRHPAWFAITQDHFTRIKVRADQAAEAVAQQPDGQAWLSYFKGRLLDLNNAPDAAAALAELRAYGAFLSAGWAASSVATEDRNRTPDFLVDHGVGPRVVEVFSKHEDRTQTEIRDAIATQTPHPAVEVDTIKTNGGEARFSVATLTPGGPPDPAKPGDSVQANLISRLCAAKGDEGQLPDDKPSLLWLDMASFGAWPDALKVEQACPLILGHWGLTSGAIWHAFYGERGSWLVEENYGGGTSGVKMGHDGRFRLSGKRKSKLCCVIIRLSETCILFENPWAAHRLTDEDRLYLTGLPDVDLAFSVLDWKPGDIEKSLELAKTQMETLIPVALAAGVPI